MERRNESVLSAAHPCETPKSAQRICHPEPSATDPALREKERETKDLMFIAFLRVDLRTNYQLYLLATNTYLMVKAMI